MKYLLILGTLFISSIFASDSCYQTCNSDANQIGLMCQKIRQTCFKLGNPESVQYELCMDDVANCLQEGQERFESCVKNCSEE